MTDVAPVLVDTCAAIWLVSDDQISPGAITAIDQAADAHVPIFVSPFTAWEIGMLVAKSRIALMMTPERWFEQLLAIRGVQLGPLTTHILIASHFLPGRPPNDPADRIIAASARALGATLVTRDRALLDYAKQGHLSAIAC